MINDYEATEPITSTANPMLNKSEMSNDDVISTLNELIETCRDGQEGFREAAEAVENSETKTFFAQASTERAQFVGELQSLVRELGGEPAESGSFAGTIHRGWIDLKAAIAGNDEHSVLVECERGEDSAKRNYTDALGKDLPANVRTVLQTQCDAVIDCHNRVKALRDATSNDNSASSTASSAF